MDRITRKLRDRARRHVAARGALLDLAMTAVDAVRAAREGLVAAGEVTPGEAELLAGVLGEAEELGEELSALTCARCADRARRAGR